MLLKRSKYSGYILFESLLAFAVATLILIQLIPLILFMEEKKQHNRDKLEVYRYFSEIANGFYSHGKADLTGKKSNGLLISAQVIDTVEQMRGIELEMAGEQFEIIWLSEREEVK
ncbi:hypothetical protein I6N95_21070 [Vagococcus sp. BWB3-3]|uniref:Uncharacterized protein n=1 Tax=Vagococcus allomyrinae TaxID=2794353 RepID=A0A940PH93_9ENTE|nr:hypothetical protein [Vagococcus allomyrinae]MBP1043521.1 hypothetical protein [Vagococcus allomyrinae]